MFDSVASNVTICEYYIVMKKLTHATKFCFVILIACYNCSGFTA